MSMNLSKQQTRSVLLNCCTQGCSIFQDHVLQCGVVPPWKGSGGWEQPNTLICTNLNDLQTFISHLKCHSNMKLFIIVLACIPNPGCSRPPLTKEIKDEAPTLSCSYRVFLHHLSCPEVELPVLFVCFTSDWFLPAPFLLLLTGVHPLDCT